MTAMTAAPEPSTSPTGEPVPTGEPLQALLRPALERCAGVRLAFLFGSQARGSARDDSDVDVALLSTAVDLLALASDLSAACGREVDVVSLDDPGIPLLEELLRDAQLVFEREPGNHARWRSRALTLLDIDGPANVRMREAWLARVAREGVG